MILGKRGWLVLAQFLRRRDTLVLVLVGLDDNYEFRDPFGRRRFGVLAKDDTGSHWHGQGDHGHKNEKETVPVHGKIPQ